MPKSVETTSQLHLFCMLEKYCSKFSKPGFNSRWTENFQMFKLDLEKAEEPEINLPTSRLPLWLRWYKINLQCGRPGFNPWVGKIPWRRERLPTPVFWLGEFHGLYSLWGSQKIGHDWVTFTFTVSYKKQENSRTTSTSASLTMLKSLTVWITTNCGQFWKRWEYQTSLPASWETCMQFKKQQLEPDMEQWTSSR